MALHQGKNCVFFCSVKELNNQQTEMFANYTTDGGLIKDL